MDEAVKWSLAFVDKVPPIPASNLLAFVIVTLLIIALVRKAMRTTPDIPPDVRPVVMLDAGSVYTVLTDMQMELRKITGRMETLEQMLRRRHKPVRKQKKRAAPSDETE